MFDVKWLILIDLLLIFISADFLFEVNLIWFVKAEYKLFCMTMKLEDLSFSSWIVMYDVLMKRVMKNRFVMLLIDFWCCKIDDKCDEDEKAEKCDCWCYYIAKCCIQLNVSWSWCFVFSFQFNVDIFFNKIKIDSSIQLYLFQAWVVNQRYVKLMLLVYFCTISDKMFVRFQIERVLYFSQRESFKSNKAILVFFQA